MYHRILLKLHLALLQAPYVSRISKNDCATLLQRLPSDVSSLHKDVQRRITAVRRYLDLFVKDFTYPAALRSAAASLTPVGKVPRRATLDLLRRWIRMAYSDDARLMESDRGLFGIKGIIDDPEKSSKILTAAERLCKEGRLSTKTLQVSPREIHLCHLLSPHLNTAVLLSRRPESPILTICQL